VRRAATWPAMKSLIACPPPLYGTWVSLIAARLANIPQQCAAGNLPRRLRREYRVSLSRVRSARRATSRRARDARQAPPAGANVVSPGMKSFTGSKLSLG